MEKGKDIYMYVLGALVVLGFMGLLGVLIFKGIPEINKDILNITVGALIGSFTSIVGYFFGSSKGSADKNKMLQNGNTNK